MAAGVAPCLIGMLTCPVELRMSEYFIHSVRGFWGEKYEIYSICRRGYLPKLTMNGEIEISKTGVDACVQHKVARIAWLNNLGKLINVRLKYIHFPLLCVFS